MMELAASSVLVAVGGSGGAARRRAGQPTHATPGAAGTGLETGPRGARRGWLRSWRVPAVPVGRPRVMGAALSGQAAGGQEWRARGAEGASHRFVSPLLLEPGERLLPRPAAGARGGGGGGGSDSSFTPLLSSPLSRRQRRRRQRWGKADFTPSHTEGSSRSRLAALSTLSSPARSARTSVS